MLPSPPVRAGEVNLQGGILPGTCVLEDAGGEREVEMPEVSATEIYKVVDARVPGAEAQFGLRFSRCVGVAGVGVSFGGSAVPGRGQYLNAGDASGVALELVDDDNGSIMPAGGYRRVLTVGPGGGAEFNGRAHYFRLGSEPLGGATMEVRATVSLDYQ